MGLSGAAAIVGILGTAASYQQQRKAVEAQEEQAQVQQRMADVEAARQRREAVRKARAQRASILNLAEQTGTAQTTGAAGGVGSVQSQLASNIGYQRSQSRLARQASQYGQEAASASGRAGLYSSISQTALDSFGGAEKIRTIFS